MKQAVRILALLAFLSMSAFAQSATNGTITLTPTYGSTSIVANSYINATGTNFFLRSGTTDRGLAKLRWRVLINGYAETTSIIQVTETTLMFYIRPGVGVVQTVTVQGPFYLQLITLSNPVIAEPVLTGEGVFRWWKDSISHSIVDDFYIPFQASTFYLALFGSGFGDIDDWVLTINGRGRSFEIPFTRHPASQGNPELVSGEVGHLDVGEYYFRVYARNNPGLTSNTFVATVR